MPLTPTYQRSRQLLSTPLEQIRGVGPRLAEKLQKTGLTTVEDALYTLPFRYEDRRSLRRIAQLRDGQVEVFYGEILAAGEGVTSRSRKKLFEVIVGDGSGQISLKWFHYRKEWMVKRFALGRKGVFIGELKRFGQVREIHHPEVEFIEGEGGLDAFIAEDPLSFGRILPVYPLTEGLSQKVARKIWKEVVDRFAPVMVSPLPVEICRRRNLLPLPQALAELHWPQDPTNLEEPSLQAHPARRSLVYDEFFFLELGLALKRQGVLLEPGIPFAVEHRYTKPLSQLLPYRLTAAQRRVLGEIKQDLMLPHPMNRLLQGDVGSGKTIVALMAALVAIENDTQVALVAPTELLAEQHYLNFRPWMAKLGLEMVFLSGSLTAKERRDVLIRIGEGRAHLVVGTHAVLQQGVEFQRLGLGIIDEQHRFGVRQRGILRHKGENPHILVMTATPIPRTLALTVYGDLAVSVIDELPPGRTPIKTRVVPERQRTRAYQEISKHLAQGRQAYIVYPLVEESEKSDLRAATEGLELLRNTVFADSSLGIIHGRMKSNEKEAVMAAFNAGDIQILVATTVIEVGIDVPNATVMLVEHAERFGLAQLHQLRGRVGRGQNESICLLLRSEPCGDDAQRRLQVMEETCDGFRIAEADLEIRGPGEFLGTRQAGLADFRIANLLRDGRVLEEARIDAFELAQRPDFFDAERYADLRHALLDRWGSRLELAGIG